MAPQPFLGLLVRANVDALKGHPQGVENVCHVPLLMLGLHTHTHSRDGEERRWEGGPWLTDRFPETDEI